MANLPTGTVTFLFTDIEGSTRLWEQHPEAMQTALARHDALLTDCIQQHEGVVIKSRGEGDSFFAAFARATDAVAAACALQRALLSESWSTGTPLTPRVALHTGEAQFRGDDYFGAAVNRCARLRAAAHGGQVLLSLATQELVRDHLPEGVSLQDLGEHRLKDVMRPEHIFQLAGPDLPGDFPPLSTLDLRRHNLPVQRTPLLGREREVAAVRELLLREAVGLVTLTGPGGTGKTRLGLQVAADLMDAFPDGVFFVDLAPISDPALVVSTIAQRLGVQETVGQALVGNLKDYLSERQLLLLLDNFEQVVEAAPLVAELLAAAPGLKALVTSRAVLHLLGEHEFAVQPLTVPDTKRLPPVEVLSQYGAVELFIQRAVAAKADFAITSENAPAVAEICHRLDGLPLAIELAAARVRLLPPQALLSRLENRLKLLTSGARDLPVRQQTLRSAIAWSYDLLDEPEKRFFRWLSVFVGGWTLETAEAVCNGAWDLPVDVLEATASLVEKSLLLQQEGPENEPRFTMLETIREYAQERLEASGEGEALRQQHGRFFLALAEAAEPKLHSSEQRAWLERLEREHDNLRAALTWSGRREEERVTTLRLAGALAQFWCVRGHLAEGRRWLEGALGGRTPATGSPDLAQAVRHDEQLATARAKALDGAGLLAWHQDDDQTARPLLEESVALWRELGDPRGLASALVSLGWVAMAQDRPDEMRSLGTESLALARELDDPWCVAQSLYCLGMAMLKLGDQAAAQSLIEEGLTLFRRLGDKQSIAWGLRSLGLIAGAREEFGTARSLHEESLLLFQELGNRYGTAHSLNSLGEMALFAGDREAARSFCEDGLTIDRDLGHQWGVATAQDNLGEVARLQGDLEAARACFEDSLALWQELGQKSRGAWSLNRLGRVLAALGQWTSARSLYSEALGIGRELSDRWCMADCLACLAEVAGARGRPEQAAQLFGVAEVLLEACDARLSPADRAEHLRQAAAVRAALDEAAFTAAWTEGRAMALEEAVACALQETADAGS